MLESIQTHVLARKYTPEGPQTHVLARKYAPERPQTVDALINRGQPQGLPLPTTSVSKPCQLIPLLKIFKTLSSQPPPPVSVSKPLPANSHT